MKKDFSGLSGAAEEIINGVKSPGEQEQEQVIIQEEPEQQAQQAQEQIYPTLPPKGFYIKYVEKRDKRLNVLTTKTLSDKIKKEAKERKIPVNALINAIFEEHFLKSDTEKEN